MGIFNIFGKKQKKPSGLTDIQKQILEEYKTATAMPCYVVEVTDGEPTSTDSSIGGSPYLPKGATLPMDKTLFAQLNLEGTNLDGLPNKGIFQVFLGEMDYPQPHEIRYYETVSNDVQSTELQESDWVSAPLKLKMSQGTSYMGTYPQGDEILLPIYNKYMNTNLDQMDELPHDYEQIAEEIQNIIPHANFGGHGDTTQAEEFDYDKNTVLLKINNYLHDDICIGDMGILWVQIDKNDLKKGDITKATVGWDCG